MKKKWKEPEILVQKFVPNEYVSACGILGDGTVLYSANIRKEIAYQREPAGLKNYVQDDTIFDPHKIYMGAFYRDKELTQPDSTQNGHQEQEDYGAKECVREIDKSPWGYHYHFIDVTNHS